MMNFSEISLNFMDGIDVDSLILSNPSEQNKVCGVITPHAGYGYSGDLSAKVFNSIEKRKYDNVFILSTSHTTNFIGAYVPVENVYNTPYGTMKINNSLKLQQYDGYFKNDHTIEVQLPFIQKLIEYESIVPIMVGDSNITNLFNVSKILEPYFNDDNLFVISSDFSHYPDYNEAVEIDNETKEIILRKNSKDFINGIFQSQHRSGDVVTRMCGWSAYLIFLFMIENRTDVEINVLKYKNSAESYGDRKRTVGYFGMSFIKK